MGVGSLYRSTFQFVADVRGAECDERVAFYDFLDCAVCSRVAGDEAAGFAG
jgi:hypothetical protein